ncbi:MAG: DUF3943 domain-containing protein [bacterium]|nr:DUF3943 domain-containing protein [bacterium]
MRKVALVLLLLLLAAPVSAQRGPVSFGARSALEDTALVRSPNFHRTATQVVGLNMLVWSYDRFIREGGENPGFRIGFNSWRENLESGFNWDDNGFGTNQFAHPFHGSLYFNSARSNGYDFWSSMPFAFTGSWLWEYVFETHNPALNDWVATSVGGSALGEIFHRLSQAIRDNTVSGTERNWREMGGLLVNPVGGLNRILDGDWGRRYANHPDRLPRVFTSQIDIGLRTRGEDEIWNADTTDVFVELEFDYGDPFAGDIEHPYDHFDFMIQLNFGDKSSVARMESNGVLGATVLKETAETSHILGAFHRYDFVNTNAIEFGGQSFTAGLNSRYRTVGGLEMRTEVHAGPLILGGTTSDYENVSGRSYDYGPGAAARVAASFGREGWHFLRVSHEQFWIHAVSGNRADHHVATTRFRFQAHLRFNVGLGTEYVLLRAERTYADYPDVSVKRPQGRIFFTWAL